MQASLHTVLSPFNFIFILVPPTPKLIYGLTCIFLKTSIASKQVNQPLFIAEKSMISFNLNLVVATSK